MSDIVYSARAISKQFGPQVALDSVDLDVVRGQVLGLVGANGAGKSTLMKILAGTQGHDSGELLLNGKPLRMTSMRDAWDSGIAFVSQELNLFPALSILENLKLVPGSQKRRDKETLAQEAVDTLRKLGLNRELSTKVSALPLADRQLVEIARALLQHPEVLILDEPTSALHPAEVGRLLGILGSLRDEGVAMVYISHFLDELMRISNSLVVLRDGRRVPFDPSPKSHTIDSIIKAMLGDLPSPVAVFKTSGARSPDGNPVALRIRALEGPRNLKVDSFVATAGEVVGVAGLAGAGVEELFQILFGKAAPIGGSVALPSGKAFSPNTNSLVRSGVAYFPADRKHLGLTLQQSIVENVSAVRALTLGLDGFIPDRRRQAELTRSRCKSLSVKMASIDQPAAALSGGNQQRVVFARWLEAAPALLMLDDPMRGVDVGSKREMYKTIRELATDGRVILFSSSDPADYVAVVDRLVVFVDGAISDTLTGADLNEHQIVASMNGQSAAMSTSAAGSTSARAIH